MTDRLMALLQENCKLERRDVGQYACIKAGVMKFAVSQYEVQGMGNLCLMRATGLAGLMKMDTIILTPFYRDAPLYSYDRILAMGNDTMLTELYDTLLSPNAEDCRSVMRQLKQQYADLPAYTSGAHWYDGIKLPESVAKKARNSKERLDSLAFSFFEAYISWLKQAPQVQPQQKKEKTKVYCDGLLENGGPSTDAFVKALGKEKTALLFHKILFATE